MNAASTRPVTRTQDHTDNSGSKMVFCDCLKTFGGSFSLKVVCFESFDLVLECRLIRLQGL